MKVVKDNEVRRLPATCVAVGVFDGVHLGHQAVLRRAVSSARRSGLLAAALTFDPHPEQALHPRRAPRLLTTIAERADLLSRFGIEIMVIARFDRCFANMTPEQFARCVLVERLNARCVVAGEGFVFGRGASGDIAALIALGRELGFSVSAVRRVRAAGLEVSSTRVRELVARGDLERARALLGRHYTIGGRVVRGARRGRGLGFPTANLCVAREKLLPPQGVYAARARLVSCAASGKDAARPAVVNIGVRPTFGGARRGPCIEAHLLDEAGSGLDLYGCEMTLEMVARLRPERAFPGAAALARQIRRDIERARRALAR